MSETGKALNRVRHELKFRICDVVRKAYLTPKMIRVEVTSPALEGFASIAHDDHVKLFFAPEGESLPDLVPGPNGLKLPEGVALPAGRDFTPRRFDAATNVLTLDFVVHEGGPATNWAKKAEPGDTLGIGGPRASFVVGDGFDWYLVAGDETALPAIGRFAEEAAAGQKVIAYAEIADATERQDLEVVADVDFNWVERGERAEGTALLAALEAVALPEGDGFIFIAGEGDMAKAARALFVERGHNADWIKAAGYWRKGEADFYDGHEH